MREIRMFVVKKDAEKFFHRDDPDIGIEQCEVCHLWTASAADHDMGGIVGPYCDEVTGDAVHDRVCEHCHEEGPTARYMVTHKVGQALRGLTTGRSHETVPEAQKELDDLLKANTSERLAGIFGTKALGTFKVRAVPCWRFGDPQVLYFDDPSVGE